MKESVKLYAKNIFGRRHLYPYDKKSEIFAKLLEQKTITIEQAKMIKDLGFNVQIAGDNEGLEGV